MVLATYLTVVAVVITGKVFSLTELEHNYIKRKHQQLCGRGYMCSDPDRAKSRTDCKCPCQVCSCDDLCHQYGDCCVDKVVDDTDSPNLDPTRYRCNSNAIKIRYGTEEFYFRSIQKCSLRNDENLIQLCEHPDTRNFTLAVPAQTEYDLYRNQFCAECNGERTYTLWDIKAECLQIVSLKTETPPSQIIHSLVDDERCNVVVRPSDGFGYRECYPEVKKAISSCNVSGQLEYLSDDYEKLCHSYSVPMDFGQIYRNIFCYMCNEGSLNHKIPCSCFGVDFTPFSLIVDPVAIQAIQETVSLSCKCKPGYIFDTYMGECKLVQCVGDRILRDEVCVPVIRPSKGFKLLYLLELLLKPKSSIKVRGSVNLWSSVTAEKLEQHMLHRIRTSVIVELFRVGINVRRKMSEREVQSIFIHCIITLETYNMEKILIGLRHSEWVIQLYNTEVPFKAEPYWSIPNYDTSYPVVTEDVTDDENSIFRLDHVLNINMTKKRKPLYVAETLKCPRVKVSQDLDLAYNEEFNTWKITGSNETLDLNQFEPSSNTSGFICYSAFKENVTDCGRPDFRATLIYVSLVCQVLSLLCLFATFLVFCIFKSLRTLPGKNTMSLVFTLFVAIFLYTTGSARVEDKVICKVVGISIHFFLLSSFTWMAVCTVHMFTVFRNILLSRHSDTSNTKKYILYLIVSIILPGIIVGATVAGNYFISNGQDIGYGINICYVSNFYTVILAVVAPIAVVMIVNGSLFTATVIALRKSANEQRELKTKRNSISIYAKMSTLTGVNWYFSLVSIFVDSDVIKYIFVVVCGLQGVYIFVSFVTTASVLRLIRDCCRNVKSRDIPDK